MGFFVCHLPLVTCRYLSMGLRCAVPETLISDQSSYRSRATVSAGVNWRMITLCGTLRLMVLSIISTSLADSAPSLSPLLLFGTSAPTVA